MERAVDIESMRLIVAIDEHRSVSAAARSLGVSQPAASARLREIEARFRVALVRRSSQGSRLTEDGQAVCAWARSVLREADILEAGIAALGERDHHDLKVAASLTVAEYLMPLWLARMRATSPDVQVRLTVVNSALVLEEVRAGKVAIGFVEGPSPLPSVCQAMIGRDRLLVVVGAYHRWWTRRRPLSVEQLRDEPFILRELGSGTRQTFTEALGSEPHVAMVANSTATLVASAVAGIGPAVVSSRAVREQLAAATLKAIPTQSDLSRPLRAIWPEKARLRWPASDLLTIATTTMSPSGRTRA